MPFFILTSKLPNGTVIETTAVSFNEKLLTADRDILVDAATSYIKNALESLAKNMCLADITVRICPPEDAERINDSNRLRFGCR